MPKEKDDRTTEFLQAIFQSSLQMTSLQKYYKNTYCRDIVILNVEFIKRDICFSAFFLGACRSLRLMTFSPFLCFLHQRVFHCQFCRVAP